MVIDFKHLTANQAYFAIIQAVIPRPIAWVLSDSGNGSFNLAPYSFFTGVCGDPPLIMLSIGRKPDGSRKDTWVNIEDRTDFVIHIAPSDLAPSLVASAATLPHGESELDASGLKTVAVPGWRLPRIIGPRLAMLCTRHAIHEVGNEQQGLILGQVQAMFVDDEAGSQVGERLVIDPKKIDPLSRLGGSEYATLGEIQTHQRPR